MEETFGVDDVEVDGFQIPNNDLQGLKAPSSEMYFETIEEARKYYEEYGRQNGFWIRTRTSKKGRNWSDEVTNMVFVCAKEGKYMAKTKSDGVVEGNDEREEDEKEEDENVIPKKRARNCSTVRCGCKAQLRIVNDKWSTKWKVTVFNDNHNHPLVTPSKRKKMKSNRHMPKAVKDLTEVFHKENLKVSKVPSIFDGEHMGFDSRDCYNHLRNVRHRELDGGDAQSVLTYFKNKQAKNPQFFYAIQCDDRDNLPSIEQSQILLSDPNISLTKGRKKDVKGKGASINSGRLKSGMELAFSKKNRKCNLCKNSGHDKRTCPSNPMSKANKSLEVEAQYSDSDQELT